MRRDHMRFLEHQRDATVHGGIRGARHSLKGCIDCHASARTGSVAQAPTDFCVSCHSLRGGEDRLLRLPQHASGPGPGGGGEVSRRAVLGAAAAALAGVALAPGIRLIEVARAATVPTVPAVQPGRPPARGPTPRCAGVC
jgi:hypothetical protein